MNTVTDPNAFLEFMAEWKGEEITIVRNDGEQITGLAISINSKGVNVEADGRVRSVGLNRVVSLSIDLDANPEDEGDEFDEDTEADYIADMLESGEVDLTDTDTLPDPDGITTKELAAMFHMEAKDLRVALRAAGMGVGKGRQYFFTAGDIAALRILLEIA